jgi:hypothetical protein
MGVERRFEYVVISDGLGLAPLCVDEYEQSTPSRASRQEEDSRSLLRHREGPLCCSQSDTHLSTLRRELETETGLASYRCPHPPMPPTFVQCQMCWIFTTVVNTEYQSNSHSEGSATHPVLHC